MPTVLISGAGICGPVLAWWLSRAGWTCTIVERDATPRLTGQQIDIRGAGITIIQKMGIEGHIKAACVQEKGTTFVDESGWLRASFPAGEGITDGITAEIEILRGELANVIMKAVEDNPGIKFVYGDRIVGLEDKEDRVDVTFRTGAAWGGNAIQSFDVVVAADGMHSSTRKLMFPELNKSPLYPLHSWIMFMTIPMDLDVDADMWATCTNSPGGRLALIRPDTARNRTGAYLGVCSSPDADRILANYHTALSVDEQKRAWKALFANSAKKNAIAARIIAGMDAPCASDFYMQDIAQVKIPAWTRGRMALLGDAAACPSPISGMGTTVAIVGAYFLSLELAKNPKNPAAALRAYETAMRPVVTKAQKLPPGAPQILNPQTQLGIIVLYAVLKFVSWTGILSWFEGSEASRTPVPEWPESSISSEASP
jgi:2-polyprenyl-6-methoxyphenol hydroxylase-like FAD-dependent oxidoreductase